MRILGLDLSLTSTGYVLLDDDQVAWHGSVSPRSRDVERLAAFDDWIRSAVIDRGRGLIYAAIEGYSFGSISHHHAIGELGGVIKLALHDLGVDTRIIPPATWKKQLLGKGNLAKDLVRLEVFRRYGIEFASQDVVDAWCVAMCLRRQLLGVDKPEPKVRRRRVVADIPAQEAAALDEENSSPVVRPTRAAAV